MQTTDMASSPATLESRDLVGHKVHPWMRYFARMVDMNLSLLLVLGPVIFVVVFLLALVSPSTANGFATGLQDVSKNRIADIVLTCLAWVPLEFLFMSILGTTPGKWVFGIRIRDQHGNKLKPALAAKRAAGVYIMGLGCGIPFISLITLVMSYNRLNKESITTWDEQMGTEVNHLPLGVLRYIGIVVTLLLTVLLIFYGFVG
jgi:uncharacterized RDD family membrane protein YckC